MRFGWLTLAASPSPEQDQAAIGQQIELACTVEALGFDSLWLTEHYFTGESVYNDALTFAAALAMKTSRIRIGFAVVQMPFHHPVRLATQLALLDNLSNGRIDVGIGKGTVFNEYEFIGHGLRSDDSRARMEEAQSIFERLWREAPLTHQGKYYNVHVPALRPKPVQPGGPPLWRSVISPGSFRECGLRGIPILTSRLSVPRIRERWATYGAALEEGGHDAATRARLMESAALWRNVYVGESDAEAEDTVSRELLAARHHINHLRATLNPPDFVVDPAVLNPWADASVPDEVALPNMLETGTLFGSAKRVREQVAELHDAGVRHLLCQTGFGEMEHGLVMASTRRFGEEVLPAFRAH